ncbi:MAG: UPF0280 family protein [Casimicrobiaceae bacterium]
MNAPVVAMLADGRLHLQHGPIDLVIAAEAPDRAIVLRAYRAAAVRFDGVLAALVAELPVLRARVGDTRSPVHGPVAQRMAAAVWPHRDVFITPMAAVAGSVADEILTAMIAVAPLERAYVNNGGDIALHLAPGQSYRIGVVGDLAAPAIDATVTLDADHACGGIATSGWRGRSLCLGIADAVTVLAATAAAADAATKPIAMAVNADHPTIRRVPARSVRDDSDLGELPVVVDVGPLPAAVIAAALARGVAAARTLQARGLIHSAYLRLKGECRMIPPLRASAALPQKAVA